MWREESRPAREGGPRGTNLDAWIFFFFYYLIYPRFATEEISCPEAPTSKKRQRNIILLVHLGCYNKIPQAGLQCSFISHSSRG